MGLEGTLRVFSLNDIFQVLGLQRKSGVLTVEGEDDTVTIAFLGGQVVSAESAARRLGNRIGSLLVRAGRLTQEQLDSVLQVQTDTQQRLGFLLIRERLVTPEDLREALRLQIFRIVYSAFRWSDGRFRFTQEGPIDYDADHMSPVPTESILMEAAQMSDEWPLLEKKIRSRDKVYRRAAGVEALRLVTSPDPAGEGALAVGRSEAEVWRLVNGERSVSEILEQAFLSDFDVYKGLSELLDRNLIEEGRSRAAIEAAAAAAVAAAAPPPKPRAPALLAGAWIAVLVFGVAGAFVASRHRWDPLLRPTGESATFGDLYKSLSLARLVRIERAVRVYYDSTGQYPKSLDDLTLAGLLDEDTLRDPYGRTYRYILRPDDGKFGIYGRNATGAIDLDLSFDRSLAPVAEIHPGRSRVRAQEKRPGVQVIE
jgi:hypothetical protein